MKKSKIAALAAAGIMAATAITVSAASNNVPSTHPDNTIVGEDGLTDMEREIENILADPNTVLISPQDVECYAAASHPDNTIIGEDGLTDMEREIERILAENPVSTVTIYVDEFGIMTASATGDTDLEKVDNSSLSYDLWSKTFEVPNLAGYSTDFSGPTKFTPRVVFGGIAALITGEKYKPNYKSVTVRATYEDANGTRTTKRASNEGTGELINAIPDSVKNATLVEVALYYYLYDGGTYDTDYLQVAFVRIKQKAT